MSSVSFNETRRLQRKPAEGQSIVLSTALLSGMIPLKEALTVAAGGSTTAGEVSAEAKHFFTTVLDAVSMVQPELSSERLLKVVSLLSTAFSRVAKDGPHVVDLFGAPVLLAIAQFLLVPWSLECSLKFVHRPILTLLKQQYATHLSLAPRVKQFIKAAVEAITHTASNALGTADTQSPTATTTVFMKWANLLDIITVSAGTVFPEIMSELFPVTMHVAAGIVRASVIAALKSASQGPEIQQSASALALEEVRFCIRVAASHVHKEFLSINPLIMTNATSTFVAPMKDLLFYGVQMLCSPAFPKDALNAAGLLVATIPTLSSITTTNVHLLTQIIKSAAYVTGPFAAVDVKRETACGKFVNAVLHKAIPDDTLVASVFAGLSPSGKFALFKGLLSNHSASLHSSPQGCLSIIAPDPQTKNTSGVVSVIVPVALAHTSEHTDPDVRFMAIQTLDSVLRYLDFALTLPEKAEVLCAPVAQENVKDKSTVETALRGVLGQIVQIQLALWDDPTQPVSGSLYGTYDIALNVVSLLAAGGGSDALMNDAKEALAVQSDRRGKYHMLLTLIQRLSYEDFGAALTGSKYGDTIGVAYAAFATALTNMASNPKVGSVAGELYTKLATKVGEAHNVDSVQWTNFTVRPVAAAFLADSVIKVANVSDELARSNIAAHIVTPLLKKFQRSFLEPCLKTILAAPPSLSRTQTIVELTYRARSVGLDILDKEDDVAKACRIALVEALSCYEGIRLTALQLLCISTRGAEFVTAEQCRLMQTYILANVHNGGDSSARNALVNLHTRWCKRLVDSLLTNKQRDAPTETKKGKKEQTSKTAEEETLIATQWTAYAQMVFTYVAETVLSLSGSVAAGEEASVERRFTSLALLDTLWVVVEQAACIGKRNSKTVATKQQEQVKQALVAFSKARFGANAITTPVDVLVQMFAMKQVSKSLWEDCLADGWDLIQKSASRTLERFIDVAGFEALLHSATGSTINVIVASALSTIATSSVNRSSQSAIVHLSLILSHADTTALESVFPIMGVSWNTTFTNRSLLLNALCSATARDIEGFCKEQHESKNAVKEIRVKPLHGRINLCGDLFTRASRQKDKSTPTVNALAVEVLKACEASALLCTELVSGGGNQTDDNVDCRGHVIGSEGQDEAVTRGVVNNSWLGVRASMNVAESVVGNVGGSVFPEDLLRLWNSCLAATLLRTKHNGVMSKTRMTLKSFTREMIKAKSSIPVETLQSLIGAEGVSSEDESRILRRSQGLPHAILPILEAEDPVLPRALLPLALDSLVAIASRRNDLGAITKLGITASLASAHAVNALNVIKYIFDNSAFGAQITPWSQDVFLLAAGGFEDPSWAVRNSSMMLFSSVLFRIIGDHPSKGGGGVTTTLDDLYRRIPKGVAFAVQRLEATIAESINTYAVAPALFPLLLMFSMLCPEVATSKRDEERRLVELMMQCRCTRNVMARSAGSSAFAALVPPSDVPSFITTFFSDIKGAASSTDTSLLNTVHGSIMFARRIYAMYVGTVRSDTKVRLGNHASETVAVRVHDQLVNGLLQIPHNGPAALYSNFTTVGELCGMTADCIAFEVDPAVCARLVQVALTAFLSLCNIVPSSTFHQGDRGSCIQAVASCVILYGERGGSPLTTSSVVANLATASATDGCVGAGLWDEVRFAVLEWNGFYRNALRTKIISKVVRKPLAVASTPPTIVDLDNSLAGIRIFTFAMASLKGIIGALVGSEKDVSAVLRRVTTKTTLDFLSDNSYALLDALKKHMTASDVVSLLKVTTMTEIASTEVRAAALNLSTSVIFNAGVGAGNAEITEGLNEAVRACCHPSQMLKSRIAAVRTVKEMLKHNTQHTEARLVGLGAAIQLVCDDEEPVRKAMCSDLRVFTNTAFPLSQPTCLALVVSEAKQVATKVPNAANLITELLCQEAESTGDAEEDAEADGDVEEALFDAEGDNMFCEAFLLDAIASYIGGTTPSGANNQKGTTLLRNVLDYAKMGETPTTH